MARHLIACLTLIAAAGTGPGPARGQAPAKAAPLARYVPREGLAGYLELDGLDAHEAAWKASAANKLLNETKMGASIEDIVRQLVTMSQAPIQAGDLIGAFKQVARQGVAVGYWGKDPEDIHFVWVIRGGARAELRRLIDMATQMGRPVEVEGAAKAGRAIHQMNENYWWFERDDFVMTDEPGAIAAVLDGKQANAIDHPLRAALLKGEGGFEPVALGFLDFAGLPKMPDRAAELGLDGLKRLEFALGFEGEAMRTVLRAIAPSRRRGVLALLDQPTFEAGTIPPISAGVHGFVAASIDWPKTYNQVVSLFFRPKPFVVGGGNPARRMIEQWRLQFGFDLRNDLIAGLGPNLTFSMQDPAGGTRGGRAAAMIGRVGGATLSFQVGDPAALSRAVERLINMANFALANMGPMAPGAPAMEFRREPGDRPKYTLELPEGLLPPPFSTMFRPTIMLGAEQLVVGASGPAAERAAGITAAKPDNRWKPDAAFEAAIRKLPGKMVALRISDTRETMPAVVEALPILAQVINQQLAAQPRRFPGAPPISPLTIEPDNLPRAGELIPHLFPASTALMVDDWGISLVSREPIPGLGSPAVAGLFFGTLMPARMASGEATRRAQCTNNLKQIALAMHNYHSATDAFPAPAITDKDGKPLLSWRVSILPYIDQQALYDKFKRDEPWDSPHNKALIQEMPLTFRCPSRKNPEPGTTTYRVFVGEEAMFQQGQGTPIQSITDGTSNTIMVIEATDAVPWTRPDDLKFDPKAKPSLYGAGSPHPGGFNTGFADGSVRFLKNTINVQVLKALITRASGEVITADQY